MSEVFRNESCFVDAGFYRAMVIEEMGGFWDFSHETWRKSTSFAKLPIEIDFIKYAMFEVLCLF